LRPSPAKEAVVAVDVALFVSKRLMPAAAALILLASVRLVQSLTPSQGGLSAPASTAEVRVVIGR
jgi:hypothetical protein